MSFFILRDEYQISTPAREYKWYLLGGVSKEWNYLWSIFAGVSKAWTFSWNIQAYVSQTWTAMWEIAHYIAREFNYLYRVSLDFSGKVKYSFVKSRMTTRFFRRSRNGD